MIPGELSGLYYFPPEFPPNILNNNNNDNDHHYVLNDLPISFPYDNNNNLASNSAYFNNIQFGAAAAPTCSNSSASEEAEEQQMRATIDERRQRRMISNRESARRSRMRKQKHLDELWAQVVRLRGENQCLVDKLNSACDSHQQVLQENSHLKAEASHLRLLLQRLQNPNSPHHDHCRDHRDRDSDSDDRDGDAIACNAAHLRAEATFMAGNKSQSSVGLLH